MANFKKIAHINDIPLGKMKSFSLNFENIVICHTEQGFYAVENVCSHDSAPISDGHIDSDGHIVCARHGAKFDCKSGDVKAPPAVVGIETFELKIENDEIYISID
ncbi:MAG TPA: hypothetical protein ENH23_02950 [candidate division Zixibacteria bacterium]|nr:hypothetical protein [candidate division Zixibacteria bacterium]